MNTATSFNAASPTATQIQAGRTAHALAAVSRSRLVNPGRRQLAAIPNASLSGRSVLIADPNRATRSALRDVATSLGADQVEYAATAAEVLRSVLAHPPALILCEFQLQGERTGQQVLEELRLRQLIGRATIFIMVSGERSYDHVVCSAEFAPDDYLIKPFVPERLRTRIAHLLQRGQVFSKAWKMFEAGDADLAVHECRRLAKASPSWLADCLRLEVDALIHLERFDEAELVLDRVLARKPLPWAVLALCDVRLRTRKPAEAEELLHGLISEHRHFLAAYDMLAHTKETLGHDGEALDVLNAAGKLSSKNVTRLRTTGNVAWRVGELDQAEHAWQRVLERVRDSAMLQGNDYAQLAQVKVAQGKVDDLAAVVEEQQRTMRGHPEVDFIAAWIEYQREQRSSPQAIAEARLDQLLEMLEAAPDRVSPGLQVQLVQTCMMGTDETRSEAARKRAQYLLGWERTDARSRETLEDLMGLRPARAKVMEEPARKKRTLDLDDGTPPDASYIESLFSRLETQGWDSGSGEQLKLAIRRLQAAAKPGSAEDAEADFLHDRLVSVMSRFGIRIGE
jgi:DNA-binding response OmpR family regulator